MSAAVTARDVQVGESTFHLSESGPSDGDAVLRAFLVET